MIEEGQGCRDVARQLSAASKALERAGAQYLVANLAACLRDEEAARAEGYTADEIQKLEDFRQEAFQFAVDKGYDHPDYTDWVYSGVKTDKKGAVTATAATAGDNE